MKLKPTFIAIIFIIAACKSKTAAPTLIPTPLPTETLLITETSTSAPTSTPNDVFGAIPLNSVQAFNIEPIAQAIFEQTLQGYIAAGTIKEFRVDRVVVFPSGDGGLIAEIMYSLQTESDPWPEDGGTQGADGWITGKCSRFDLIATETEHQLKNKRLCS